LTGGKYLLNLKWNFTVTKSENTDIEMSRNIVAAFLILIVLITGANVPGNAQYYFGRNKVQYHQFDWHVMHTEHFDIYFYPEMRELAEVGAGYAEENYHILADLFDITPNYRIPLIFYSSFTHFQQTNVIPNLIPEGVGGFFEYLKGRVVVPANGSISQFKNVIRHELVHVFTMCKVQRVMKDHKKIDWSGLPLWFVEGLAEYWSQGWNSEAEMVIRDAVINDYLVPLSRIYQISGSFLMYKEGQAILRYIAETYGEEKLLGLLNNFWKTQNFSDVLKLTIGKGYREFDEEWTYALKKKIFPLLKDNDLPRMVSIRITEEGINTKPAYYHKQVVFLSNREGYSNIYCKPVQPYNKKQKAEIIIKGERTSEFESFHLLKSKIDVHSSGMLAFSSKSGEQDAIYIYDLQARKIVQRLEFNNLIYLSSPAWSPDGTRLVFSGIDFSGKNDIYIVNLSNQQLRRLTNDFYDDRDPCWSPDGHLIVFSSDRTEYGESGYYNLFFYDLRDGSIRYVTSGRHKDYSPVFSPDSQFLAFASDRDGSFNIWVIRAGKRYRDSMIVKRFNLNSSSDAKFPTEPYFSVVEDSAIVASLLERPQLKKITNFATGAFDPEWTDNDGILFTAFENFSFQIRKLEHVSSLFKSKPLSVFDQSPWKAPSFWQSSKHVGRLTASVVKYRRKFSLDIAQSQIMQDPIFGTSGGAQLAISDMLGNEKYYFLLYNEASSKKEFLKSFNFAVSKLDLSRRTNIAYGIYHFAGNYYSFSEGFFYERRYGGFASLSYPFSVFQRGEVHVNIRNSEKQWYGFLGTRRALLISNFIAWVKDNSLWGPTGPIDGERYHFTIGNTVDVKNSNVNFYTISADYRKYFRLGRRITYATRVMGRINHGKEAIRFFLGGSWDLRGYDRWSIWGEKLVLMNHELRFPFIDRFTIRFPFGGIGFSSIRGAAFWDLGNAWSSSFRQLRGSLGVGIRFRLGGFLVLRLDYGKKYQILFDRSIFRPTQFKFFPDTFTQFFFGWDF